MSFAVAKKKQGGYLGIEERISDEEVWELILWTSADLVTWKDPRSVMSLSGDWGSGELHYPVFLSADGWHSDWVDASDFYIVGTKDATLRALHIRNFAVLLPFITK